MATLWRILTRKKVVERAEESSLARVLNTFDLTALGVGSTLGVGMYVLVGKVARETAGPAVVLSFLIAAIASAFAGVCYAEFGARTPRAGSAYIYSYVCVGELIAFVIGWNLILEYIIGSASVARGMSLYIDALANDTLKNAFIDIAPIHVSFLSPYFDFLTFAIAVLLSIGLAFGMKESSKANNIFTILNIAVVLFVVIAGSTKADVSNWKLEQKNLPDDAGTGGFFPFGITGMIKGAATCFYGFVGFDCIATTGEEVKNPQKAIPFAIVISLFIVFLAYFGTSTVVTLMVPYYLQDVNSPIPHAFEEFHWEAAKWIVTIGGIFALCASLFGAMFPLPRIIYAMASDGLVFKFLGKVSTRFSTPVVGTLLAGIFTGILGAIFEQGQLVDMMSIGTLLAYTIVAACVLLLRYSVDEDGYRLVRTSSDSSFDEYTDSRDLAPATEENLLIENGNNTITFRGLTKQIFNLGRGNGNPTKISERLVTIEICFFCILCLLLGLCFKYLMDEIKEGTVYAIFLTSLIGFFMIVTLMSISTQPTSKKELTFKVPLVPLIPALSILVNIYLMLSLDVNTWIRFGVWMAIGLPIYFYSTHTYNMVAPKKLSNDNTYMNYGYVDDDKKSNTDSGAFFEDDSKIEIASEKSEQILKDMQNLSDNDAEGRVIGVIHREDGKMAEIVEDNNANVIENNLQKNVPMEEEIISESNEEKENIASAIPEAINELEDVIKEEEEKLEQIEIENSAIEILEGVIDVEERKLEEDEVLRALEQAINEQYLTPSTENNSEISFIPSPPPMPGSNSNYPTPPPLPNDKIKIPRITSMVKYVKLKKPVIPAADYSRKNSKEEPVDNIKVGGTYHRNFAKELDKLLTKQMAISMSEPVAYLPTKLKADDDSEPISHNTSNENTLKQNEVKIIDVPRKVSNESEEDVTVNESFKERLSKIFMNNANKGPSSSVRNKVLNQSDVVETE